MNHKKKNVQAITHSLSDTMISGEYIAEQRSQYLAVGLDAIFPGPPDRLLCLGLSCTLQKKPRRS